MKGDYEIGLPRLPVHDSRRHNRAGTTQCCAAGQSAVGSGECPARPQGIYPNRERDGFASAAVLNWNGSPRPTAVLSGTRLQATISAEYVAKAGTIQGLRTGGHLKVILSVGLFSAHSQSVKTCNGLITTIDTGYFRFACHPIRDKVP
jgi:hypothetical protein